MIDKVKETAKTDDAVSAVLMYGSFIKGEGDRYSDIEFYIFHTQEIDRREWVGRIMPFVLFFTNEHGTEVAIFENMVRGEFHFLELGQVDIVKSWETQTSFEYADKMILVDKEGRLAEAISDISRERPRHDSPEHVEWLVSSLANNLLQVKNLLLRNELAHAQHLFQYIQKYLIWMARLADKADNHWENPTRMLEQELSWPWYGAYAECVPDLDAENLHICFQKSVSFGMKAACYLGAPLGLIDLVKRIGGMDWVAHEPAASQGSPCGD